MYVCLFTHGNLSDTRVCLNSSYIQRSQRVNPYKLQKIEIDKNGSHNFTFLHNPFRS